MDNELVQLIAREVLSVLRQRGQVASSPAAAGAPSTSPHEQAAEVRPPAGVCTGDYSKFPELAKRLASSSSPAIAASTDAPPPAESAAAAPLTGIVTASQLQAAMDAAPDKVALLSPQARLSPLASDLARRFPQRVRRASSWPQAAASAAPAGDLPWLWWIEGKCPVASAVMQENQARVRAVNGAMTAALREIAAAVKGRQAAGALLFVPSAARAVCLANRCPSLRAVVGTCEQAVEEGIEQLGANVLVIEYPHHGNRSMRALVTRMLGQPPKAPAAVERDLADMQRCG
jgi:hypothetical protein